MPLPTSATRASLWIFSVFVLGFAIASLTALMSDVTRDDIAAYHHGLDASKYSAAEVGSFFEVSENGVSGPLCQNSIQSQEQLTMAWRNVVLKNKLGETAPLLTSAMYSLLGSELQGGAENAHVLELQIREFAITLDNLSAFVRRTMQDDRDCGAAIDQRTKNRSVRICPVQRIWKNRDGRTVAIFFDPMAITGCRENPEDCRTDCPRHESGQIWTAIKIQLDLLEAVDQDDAIAGSS